MSTNKLFVGGVSWDTNDAGLKAHFEQCGEVTEAKIITDRETGRSRGFGFVTFASQEGASKAVDELGGVELDGRSLRLDFAEDKQRGGGSGGSRGSNGSNYGGDDGGGNNASSGRSKGKGSRKRSRDNDW